MKKLMKFLFSPVIKLFKFLTKPFLGFYFKFKYDDKRCNTCIYYKSRLVTGDGDDYCSYNINKFLKLKFNRSNKKVCRHWSDDVLILRDRLN